MRVAVVGDVGPRRDGFFMDHIGHRDAWRAGRRTGALCAVKPSHRGEDVAKQLALDCGQVQLIEPTEGFVNHFLAALAAEHLLAHRLHDMLREYATNHRELGAVRWIIKKIELRLVAAGEKRFPRRVAKPFRNDDADRHLSPAYLI